MLVPEMTGAAARIARRFAFFVLLAMVTPFAFAQNAAAPEEKPEDYPAGAGRDDTFYACTACHGFKLIAAQGMNRRQWDESMSLMTSKHNMPAIEGKDRETILTYLETTFPPRAPAQRGGFQNPFAPR